ncbi:hypothetical protein SETIT_2G440700v2 [Setaria italica]|uniref:Negatively light-regulated protein n=1 Tax=Setaria italica TaxID=4555 RepID=A0A368Q9T5_SETIT|nr:uncharacterized protein LOC101776977 isoform X2 [Setaria italica]RCV14633.1 hypothetical protein SETIT_2G440700v2 [Setaria italica]
MDGCTTPPPFVYKYAQLHRIATQQHKSFRFLPSRYSTCPRQGRSRMADCNANSSAAIGQEQDVVVEKKYGGMAPKKPLISKDHERAYFDSADWVLGKEAANSSGARAAIESLKPKLKVRSDFELTII